MNLQKVKSFCGEDDNKCKKNSTFVAEVLSYTQKIRTLLNILGAFFTCFHVVSAYFPLLILRMIFRLASLILDVSIEAKYVCVVLIE